MNQDGSVIRLSNPAIAATFNLSSGEWEVLMPDGRVLYSGFPSIRKEPQGALSVEASAPAVSHARRSAENGLRPGRGSMEESAAMRRGPKPDPPPAEKKRLKMSTQTFSLSRTLTCRGPGLRIEAETGGPGRLRIAIPDEGPWVFVEPLFDTVRMFEGIAYPSGDWAQLRLAVNDATLERSGSRLESLNQAVSSRDAVCLHRRDTGETMVFGAWQNATEARIDLEPNREAARIGFKLQWESSTPVPRGSNWWFFGAFPNVSATMKVIKPALNTRQDGGTPVLSVVQVAAGP